MLNLKKYLAIMSVVVAATALAGVPAGYTSAVFDNATTGASVEFGLVEPESEDPTSEFPLFVLSGVSDDYASKFANELESLQLPAYVYFVPATDVQMVSVTLRTQRVDPDRVYLIGENITPYSEVFTATVSYNTSAESPVVYTSSSDTKGESFGGSLGELINYLAELSR